MVSRGAGAPAHARYRMAGMRCDQQADAGIPLPDGAAGVSLRADIVAALSTVRVEWRGEEVILDAREYNDYTKDAPAPFAAWPEWEADEPSPDPRVVHSIGRVTIILPGSSTESPNSTAPDAAALDAVRWPVRVALETLGGVSRAELSSYTVQDYARMPAIRYTLTIRLVRPEGTRE